jgi:hypothetical protein
MLATLDVGQTIEALLAAVRALQGGDSASAEREVNAVLRALVAFHRRGR